MVKYPDYDPVRKGKNVAQTVMAVARMHHGAKASVDADTEAVSHENKPLPRTNVRKTFLLNDTHETCAFRSASGSTYAAKKTAHATGSLALKCGYGWAIKLFPTAGWIPSHGTAMIECTAYSDLPGVMDDKIRLNIRELPTLYVPAALVSTGSALYLPPLQVSLNTNVNPAVLDCGSMVMAETSVTRTFKLANSSESDMLVHWSVYAADAVENVDRPMISFRLEAGDAFGAEAVEPASEGPARCPVAVAPPSGVLTKKGTTTFTVTLTPECPGSFRYKLVGVATLKERRKTAEDDERAQAAADGKSDTSQLTLLDSRAGSRAAPAPGPDEDVRRVRDLDEIPCDADSDEEDTRAVTFLDPHVHAPRDEEEPLESICTMVLDVLGQCIVPKLTIDKRIHGTYGMPVVKYYHTSVPDGDLHRSKDPRFPSHIAPGATVVGGGVKDPARGVVSALLRGIMFKNDNRCPVYTRMRIDNGPFRICRVERVGEFPDKTGKDGVFAGVMAWKHSMEVWIEFQPPPWQKWAGSEESFEGELVVEYPADECDPSTVVEEESQRIKLVAVCRKPKLWIDLVSVAEPYAVPRPVNEDILVVEFFRVHVQALVEVKRRIVLRNESNVRATWKVFHVARKLGRKASESDSLDSPECFVFAQSEGELYGPSLPYRCLPLGPALEHYLPHDDTDEYRPHFVQVAFHPKKDEEYMSRFRFQVEGGPSLDIICHGHGSYNEEDDVMELVEA